jgi:hypothetical protein
MFINRQPSNLIRALARLGSRASMRAHGPGFPARVVCGNSFVLGWHPRVLGWHPRSTSSLRSNTEGSTRPATDRYFTATRCCQDRRGIVEARFVGVLRVRSYVKVARGKVCR